MAEKWKTLNLRFLIKGGRNWEARLARKTKLGILPKMERLIYSNSIPSKHHQSASPVLPRKPASSSTSFPLLLRPGTRGFNPLFCTLNNSSFLSPKALEVCPETNLSVSVDSENGSKPKPRFLNWAAQRLSQHQKVLMNFS